ncbi:GNAT family N-acetyltransferase [Haladaptatus halobius]|uniref:GNAT family N-acetyltransferase n=1 Tax=Haladaptatus halobius TaxID=2884875 RepID=UPI001D0B07B9|nr:GNAT family N-acetyltransferase [Haladaptatus halobius]
MEFREATAEDVESVQRVARTSWHQAHDHLIGEDAVDEILGMWYDRDALTESIDRDDAPMFLAVDDGEVVGFAQGEPSNDGPADAVVGRIYVLPEYWGKGAGTNLLNRLFDSFRAAGHESVWLSVMADNDVGRSFYDKHGFNVHEERTVELTEQEIDDVILVRGL